MNCRETRPLLPLFFDGELEARQMRAVALHSTRCPECEGVLRGLERLQDTLTAHVSSQLEQIDLDRVWQGVAPRLGSPRRPRFQRLRDWWTGLELHWPRQAPVYAALAAVCLLAILLWPRDAEERAVDVATADNSTMIDAVQSNVESLAVLREPETDTLVLWITDDRSTADDLVDFP